MTLTRTEIDAMSLEEKLELSAVLWESIDDTAMPLPVPDWHPQLLDESLIALDNCPNDCGSWEEVKERLRRDT